MRGHRSLADPSENKRRRVDVGDDFSPNAAKVSDDEWVEVVNALINQDVEEEASCSATVGTSSSVAKDDGLEKLGWLKFQEATMSNVWESQTAALSLHFQYSWNFA